MSARVAPALIVTLLVIAAAMLYTRTLGYVPPYLIHDEAQGALQAHAIATTGRDLNGRLLPLYFSEPEFPPGRDPAMIYVTAAALTVAPFTESGVRIPTTLVAVLNIALMFFAARAVFHSAWAGVFAALMLMLAPVHFIRGRLLLSPLYSIPFVLGWLWSLARFEAAPSARRYLAACVWLAAGMYSYLAAVVMMPLYLLTSVAVAARSLRVRAVTIAAVTLIVCLFPMAVWYLTHPERNAQIVSAYQLAANSGESRVAILSGMLAKYSHLYWSFFDPAYFFVSGDPSLINSTRTAGLFPMAFAVLLPIGVVALLRSRQSLQWVIIAGFFAAPLVSVISGAIEMNRVMFAIPFAVLVATAGAMSMWSRHSLTARVAAAALMCSIPLQFSAFHRAYESDGYRVASAAWYSGGVREALRELIARAGTSPIYVSQEIEWVHRFWRFYAIEAGRQELIDRTTYFRTPPADAPEGAKLMCPAESQTCAALEHSSMWRSVVSVPSIGGDRHFIILERLSADQHRN